MKQELPTIPEHLSSLPVFSRVRVTRSLFFYVCFIDRCLSFCYFSFGHYVLCSSSIYGFWLPLWYIQTFLTTKRHNWKDETAPRYSYQDVVVGIPLTNLLPTHFYIYSKPWFWFPTPYIVKLRIWLCSVGYAYIGTYVCALA